MRRGKGVREGRLYGERILNQPSLDVCMGGLNVTNVLSSV